MGVINLRSDNTKIGWIFIEDGAMQRDKESIYLDKAVRKYHEVSKKELENVCAFVNDKPYPHPELTRYKKRPISEHIWFAGIDKWGRRWIEREYVLACRRDDVIIDEIT